MWMIHIEGGQSGSFKWFNMCEWCIENIVETIFSIWEDPWLIYCGFDEIDGTVICMLATNDGCEFGNSFVAALDSYERR